MKRQTLLTILALAVAMFALPALAASPGAPAIDGRSLSLLWIVPFAGILLSIAVMPLAVPQFWHHHFGKVSAAWALLVIVPFAVIYGVPTAVYEIIHLLLLDYIPFIVLLLALFTVTGGIHIKGNLHGSPSMNTALLAVGTVLAGWMGTTGASMLLIRPHDPRQRRPAAQGPRLRLLHLPGVEHRRRADAARRSAAVPGLPEGRQLLLDHHAPVQRDAALRHRAARRCSTPSTATGTARKATSSAIPTPESPVRIEGGVNIILLAAIVGVVLASGTWNPGVHFTVFHVTLELQHVLRDLALVAICVAVAASSRRARLRTENSLQLGADGRRSPSCSPASSSPSRRRSPS